ncbi:MAG: CTP synthase [Verrucomicrobiae bacterium]|nr:CTP synthase [Verrucomicrobiae bacterium]
MKYIFITGGVISSLGKGLTAAALGTLLEHRGLRVVLQKFDPYLNVDPGTMSPYQHGEVYVLDDGAETDLDLGHYERFTRGRLTRRNNLTSGQIYETILLQERRGDYLGKTVQVVPHVTDEIKKRIRGVTDGCSADVLITEVGGTTGDIEGLPFLEAIRQFALEAGPENVFFIHVTLVPYISVAGELKTKPTQQSVAKLREIGIQPHALVCRSEKPIATPVRRKISLFCNVPVEAVIEERDVEHTIYEVPLMLQREKLDELACRHLRLPKRAARMAPWRRFVRRVISPKRRVKIAVVGKYMDLQDAYKSIYEALTHAGAWHNLGVDLVTADAEEIKKRGPARKLKGVHGILIPGGFGDRGIEGKIAAAGYARRTKVPYLGLCLGMQVAVIEFARGVAGLKRANSAEFDEATPDPVISLLEEQRAVRRKGASMRLGAWPCRLVSGTRAAALYGKRTVRERHRHRYEFNNAYRSRFEQLGMVFSGVSPRNDLVEIVEIKGHPWFMACQFHPEFQSRPNRPHPLFRGFLGAAGAAA